MRCSMPYCTGRVLQSTRNSCSQKYLLQHRNRSTGALQYALQCKNSAIITLMQYSNALQYAVQCSYALQYRTVTRYST